MKIKCRILSVFVIAICMIVVIASLIVIKNNKDKAPVYAQSINFVGIVGGAELYIYNDFVIGEDLVTISPSNCTVKPEFLIKKSGEDEYTNIGANKYCFDKPGKHILVCKVLKSKDYYIQDKIVINVVEMPTEITSMYIKLLINPIMYENDTIKLDDIVEIISPVGATTDFVCGDNITLNDGIITAFKAGYATLEIIIKKDNINISKLVTIFIKPQIVENDIRLQLTVGTNVVPNNEIEIPLSKFNHSIIYELFNTDKQSINCWADSDIVEVVSHNPMIIELKTISTGTATIYVSPIDFPDMVFEFVVKIV